MESRRDGMSSTLVAVLILFQIACPLIIVVQAPRAHARTATVRSDVERYREIVGRPGTPYRDFDVEYPPVALGVFRAIGPSTYDTFRLRLLAIQVLAQALIVLLLFRCWSRRAGTSYLLLSAPMLFIVYLTYDLTVVAIAVAAATLVRLRHPVAGAIGFVLGAFMKLWPAVLLPGLLVRGKPRAFIAGLATAGAGLVAWTAWGGTSAIGQVVSYRGADGWEFESLPGSALRVITRDALRFESGSWRLGAPPRAFGIALLLALVAVVAAIWWLAAQRPTLPDGLAETAAIVAVLVFGTLLSPQFLIWPLPFVAIAAAGGARRVEEWALAVGVLTLLDRIVFDPANPSLLTTELVVVARNVALVGLLVVAVMEMRRPATKPLQPART